MDHDRVQDVPRLGEGWAPAEAKEQKCERKLKAGLSGVCVCGRGGLMGMAKSLWERI
jgi:hypothetical protein